METDYRKAANITIIIIGILLLLRLVFQYALGALIPFILAAIIALLISPLAERLSKTLRIKKRIVSVALTLLIFSAIAVALYFAVSRLVSELGALANRLSSDPEAISRAIEELTAKLEWLGDRFSFIGKILESDAIKNLGLDLDRLLPEAISSIISSITEAIPSIAVDFFSKIPNVLLFAVVLAISTFYFCSDGERIFAFFSSLLPDHWQKKLPDIRKRLYLTVTGYFKAYLLIMLLTFCEVFLGLSILGVEYAFLISIIVALVDILPILGTGTVLVPWTVFSFATSNYKMGIGLLVIYGVVSLVRQVAEPKIVGDSLGLHPLATLASIYICVKLIGISGFFIGPALALLITSFFKADKSSEESPAQAIGSKQKDAEK